MTYMERIANESPAALIAAEAASVKWALGEKYPTLVWKHRSPKQARINAAAADKALAELRTVWTLAHAEDPAWREELVAWVDRHEKVCGLAKVRYRLIAAHSPAPTEAVR